MESILQGSHPVPIGARLRVPNQVDHNEQSSKIYRSYAGSGYCDSSSGNAQGCARGNMLKPTSNRLLAMSRHDTRRPVGSINNQIELTFVNHKSIGDRLLADGPRPRPVAHSIDNSQRPSPLSRRGGLEGRSWLVKYSDEESPEESRGKAIFLLLGAEQQSP